MEQGGKEGLIKLKIVDETNQCCSDEGNETPGERMPLGSTTSFNLGHVEVRWTLGPRSGSSNHAALISCKNTVLLF